MAAGNGSQIFFTFPMPLGPSKVRRILITFPPGCGGLVGVAITAGGSAAFPVNNQSFFSFDDYTYRFDVQNQLDSGNWGLVYYNRDYIDHAIQVIMEYDYLGVGPGITQQPPVSL